MANVNVNNRIVCYDIKELGKQMKKLGMLIVESFFKQSRKRIFQFHAGDIQKTIDLDAKKVAEYYCTGLPTIVTNLLFVIVTIYLFAAKSILLAIIFAILSVLQTIPHVVLSSVAYC